MMMRKMTIRPSITHFAMKIGVIKLVMDELMTIRSKRKLCFSSRPPIEYYGSDR